MRTVICGCTWVVLLMQVSRSDGFMCPTNNNMNNPSSNRLLRFALQSSASSDIASMRVGELKKELESYGISTKSFLEKTELVDAVEKARADGKTPVQATTTTTTTTPSPTASTPPSTDNSASKKKKKKKRSSSPEMPRDERIAEEMTKCSTMKAGELKKELEGMGVSTRSFFEKTEFVRALAEARVDGVGKQTSSSSSSDGQQEKYAEYADVEVLTSDDAGPKKRSSQGGQQQQPPQGGGGNPFGGGGGGMGDMGGMGGMADMMKNMG
eukprot:CAMPEP_0197824054 /NCGR_PEP_ID=MMETSP1437-20131217/1369_1 /TAXON_ID=49252 ORGANISM="Eucampia antarctica, Strain CCMP1452" /NCGR_SAMPLE_ID=MMETSP1437 /ASSEMBLY_ACC=CAM_ASM_001096 /LENGTH=267 /DNA_ID=CAMNT_0043423533 /DNA_START=166 /DNA_END=966 /DNA_ORIENTATION=-